MLRRLPAPSLVPPHRPVLVMTSITRATEQIGLVATASIPADGFFAAVFFRLRQLMHLDQPRGIAAGGQGRGQQGPRAAGGAVGGGTHRHAGAVHGHDAAGVVVRAASDASGPSEGTRLALGMAPCAGRSG
ncbi:hypothetical protein [Streptomyces sp. NRRL B-3648]|uniref:hypothetical protein n=1 Tax=Streptomyces sp. NRRL B-3648 TaxID=1519493 RepID=UPI001F276339|nr:hypothetical protein [Streptomyces sp. NRRL B-3648]